MLVVFQRRLGDSKSPLCQVLFWVFDFKNAVVDFKNAVVDFSSDFQDFVHF